ncbi:hypothetical protein ACEUZ9_004125 [Paracoccus litorisediminis]|uniref:hypothetical protein n=1 Tax=Paracoccus litorisediminis TaxID=2006130 RepID=UPI00372FFD2C
MTAFHIFQIDHDNITPEQARAAFSARFGQVGLALNSELHQHTAMIEASDVEDLLSAEIDRPIFFGDIAIDTEFLESWVRTPDGWETLSWDRSAGLMMQAYRSEALAEPA